MSSLFPSNRPVRVFPLDQKPRWLQSAGERETERGEASRIKLEWNQMTWNIPGLKSHCAAKTQTQIYICSVKLIKLEIVRKHIKNRAIKSTFSFKPYLLSSCYSCFFSIRKHHAGAISLWLCACARLLPCLLAVCNFSSNHDRGETVQSVQRQSIVCSCCCSLPASAAGTSRLMLRQQNTIPPACQVTGCTLCLGRERTNTAFCFSTPSSTSFTFTSFLCWLVFLPQVEFYKVPPVITNFLLPADSVSFLLWLTSPNITQTRTDSKGALYQATR